MKITKNIILPLLLVTVTLFGTYQAQAALITIETDKQQYQVGEKITAFLKLSDSNRLISGFFLALQYQQSKLALVNWGHGHAFDDGFGSYQYAEHNVVNGRLALEDYADWAADQTILAAKQLGNFTLASIEFTAQSAGQFNLSFDATYFGLLTFSGDLFQPDALAGSFNVVDTPASIPTASPLALVLGGLLLLVGHRRKLKAVIAS
jgi:hypothetical protein